MTLNARGELLAKVIALKNEGKNNTDISRELGVGETTVRRWVKSPEKFSGYFKAQSTAPSPEVIAPAVDEVELLKATVKELRGQLLKGRKNDLTAQHIRERIIGLRDDVSVLPEKTWLFNTRSSPSAPGVPTLFLSDFHWGETVFPSQVNNVNEFNIEIAHKRLTSTVETATHLLKIISPKLDYPGIVIPLGGDMISGNIHEELTATNEMNSMPCVLDLYGALVDMIEHMAGIYGKVFLACVTGNHGRDTRKMWAKDRHHTSFDWLMYNFLAKRFENDKRVQFFIPDGPDALYRIYHHRYLLTHGDQYRGGDGMIGCLGPILRGDHKKRSRNAQVDMEFDTQIMGHWHQYIHHSRVIVNGSLKGMDEYAYSANFGFEPPQQALWLTHPRYGITYRMPIYSDKPSLGPKTEWVSFMKGVTA